MTRVLVSWQLFFLSAAISVYAICVRETVHLSDCYWLFCPIFFSIVRLLNSDFFSKQVVLIILLFYFRLFVCWLLFDFFEFTSLFITANLSVHSSCHFNVPSKLIVLFFIKGFVYYFSTLQYSCSWFLYITTTLYFPVKSPNAMYVLLDHF